MIPSPVNLSTVPPWRPTTFAARSTSPAMTSRNRSGPTADAISIEPTTSANNTVTCLNSAERDAEASGDPQPSQNRAPTRAGPAPQRGHSDPAAVIRRHLHGEYDAAAPVRHEITAPLRFGPDPGPVILG
jgi:hypothetical protein